MNQSAYYKAEVALRNQALIEYARNKNISYKGALRREMYHANANYEPYLLGLKKKEQNMQQKSLSVAEKQPTSKALNVNNLKKNCDSDNKSNAKIKHVKEKSLGIPAQEKKSNPIAVSFKESIAEKQQKFTEGGKKNILHDVKKKEEIFQKKVTIKQQEKLKKRVSPISIPVSINCENILANKDIAKIFLEKRNNSMLSVSLPNVKGNEKSQVQEIEQNKKENAFLNVLKMYSNNPIQETVIIDDDEENIIRTDDDYKEISHNNEMKLINPNMETNNVSLNPEEPLSKTNIAEKCYKPTNVGSEIESLSRKENNSMNSEVPLQKTNFANKVNETIHIRNVEQVNDFLESKKDSSMNKKSEPHITKNRPHQSKCMKCMKKTKQVGKNSSKPHQRKNKSIEKLNLNHTIISAEELKKICQTLGKESKKLNNKMNQESSTQNPINKVSSIEKSNKNNHALISVKNMLHEQACLSKKEELLPEKLNEINQINKNANKASFQKQNKENFSGSQPTAISYSNFNSKNLKTQHINDISHHKKCSADKQFRNETQASNSKMNNINHNRNLEQNCKTHENYFKQNDSNYTKSYNAKGNTTELKLISTEVKAKSPVHDDLQEIYKNVFVKNCTKEDKNMEHVDPHLVKLLDMYLPTEKKQVSSIEKDCGSPNNIIERTDFDTRCAKTEDKTIIETNMENEFTKKADQGMNGTCLEIDCAKKAYDNMSEANKENGCLRRTDKEIVETNKEIRFKIRAEVKTVDTNLETESVERTDMEISESIAENGFINQADIEMIENTVDTVSLKSVDLDITETIMERADVETIETNLEPKSVERIDMEITESVEKTDMEITESIVENGCINQAEMEMIENIVDTVCLKRVDLDITETIIERSDVEMIENIMENRCIKRTYVATKENKNKREKDNIYSKNENDNNKTGEVYSEIFYDDVFISNINSTAYQYCLFA